MKSPIPILSLALALTACGADAPSQKPRQGAASAEAYGEETPHAPRLTDAGRDALAAALAATSTADLTAEDAWAFAHCACATGLAARYVTAMGDAKGALPQVLVPQIRREIRSDKQLAALLQIATGAFKTTIEWLASRYLGDDQLSTMIQAGLRTRLSQALGLSGTTPAPGIGPKFRFDLFRTTADTPNTFETREQAARAAWVFALDGFWQGPDPSSGAHLLETARILAEWRYVTGDADQHCEPVQ